MGGVICLHRNGGSHHGPFTISDRILCPHTASFSHMPFLLVTCREDFIAIVRPGHGNIIHSSHPAHQGQLRLIRRYAPSDNRRRHHHHVRQYLWQQLHLTILVDHNKSNVQPSALRLKNMSCHTTEAHRVQSYSHEPYTAC